MSGNYNSDRDITKYHCKLSLIHSLILSARSGNNTHLIRGSVLLPDALTPELHPLVDSVVRSSNPLCQAVSRIFRVGVVLSIIDRPCQLLTQGPIQHDYVIIGLKV